MTERVLIIPCDRREPMAMSDWKTDSSDAGEICFDDLHAQLGDFETYYLSEAFGAFCKEMPAPSDETNERACRLLQLHGATDMPPVRGTVVVHFKAPPAPMVAKWIKEQNGW